MEKPRAFRYRERCVVSTKMGNASSKVLTFELPPRTDAVPTARSALDPLLGAISAETLDDARLLVSELVTNAIRHAGLGPGDVIEVSAAVIDDVLHVAVRDGGVGFRATPRPAESRDVGGWGLYLVSEIADRWGTTEDGHTEVWFELRARRD